MVVQITVSDSFQSSNRRTMYRMAVVDNGKTWDAQKGYSDIAELDRLLASSTENQLQRMQLPEKGTFGLRHYLNIGGFNQKRFQGIQQYFAHLASQLNSVADSHSLSLFFDLQEQVNEDSTATSSKGKGKGKGEQQAAALGAVQQAFGASEKGYDKIFDAMTSAPEFEAEFGDLVCSMLPMKKKLLSIRTLLPVAQEKIQSEARATSEKRKGILQGYRGKAAGKGIPWKESKETLESRGLETWEREREACTDPTLVYPSYWELGGKGTLHSYDAGNCCWEAAFDLPVGAYELVHAHHFPDVPAQECFSKLHQALDNATIDALQGSAATVAIDVGCGAGTSTFSLRETLNARGLEKCDLAGLDLSTYFIAVAQYRLKAGDKHDIPGSLSFVHGNALHVGYKDGAVDIFMASAITHELPKHASEELVAEAARVLRPGGVLGYFDLNPVQILRDNPVSNIVDRVAISNEPFLDDFLEFDLEKCLMKNGLEIVNIRATNEAKWPDWRECPCRIVIARKTPQS